MVRKIIRCSQCAEEFSGGFEYRMHWEEKHFYPYLTHEGFDFKKARLDKTKIDERNMENMG